MARMKEIFMEVYQQYDGDIPEGFDFDKYIFEKFEKESQQTDSNDVEDTKK